MVCDKGGLASLMLSMEGEGICDVGGVASVLLFRIEGEGEGVSYVGGLISVMLSKKKKAGDLLCRECGFCDAINERGYLI